MEATVLAKLFFPDPGPAAHWNSRGKLRRSAPAPPEFHHCAGPLFDPIPW